MGVKAPRTRVKHCACRLIVAGQSATDPDTFRKCREHSSRFINTTNGRVFLCAGHFQNHTLVGSGQDVQVVSGTRGRTA
jgi:hypothetical protein